MPNFPLSLDDDASLYLAVNNLRTRLTSSIDASTLTIPVITTSGFPNNGFLTILSDPNDITKAEAIRYEGYTLTTFSGIERGAEGTPALAHNNGDNVDLTVVADHHNELKDAIIEIEKFLGVSGSENFVPFAEGGNVILPADLSVQDNLTVSGAGDFGSLHVNDFLTVSGGATFCFVTITGTLEADNLDVNFDAGVSGTLTVGELATASGTFPDALTVSGIPVHAGDPLNIGSINAYQSMTVSGQPVSTGTGGGGSANTLQDAYDNGDGTIVVTAGTPLHVIGDEYDGNVDFKVTGSGQFTEALQVGSGTTFITGERIETPRLFVGDTEILPSTTASGQRFLEPVRIYNPLIPATGTLINGTLYDDNFIGEEDTPVDTGRWTIFDPGSNFINDPPLLDGYNRVRFQTGNDPTGAEEVVGIYQDAPPITERHAFYTRIANAIGSQTQVETFQGIIYLEDKDAPTTSNILLLGTRMRRIADVPTFEIGAWEFTSYTDTSPNQVSGVVADFDAANVDGLYLNVTWFGSGSLDRWDVHYSFTGQDWYQIDGVGRGSDTTMTDFDAVGLGMIEVGGFVSGAVFNFFRGDDLGGTVRPVPAGFMFVETDPTASGSFISGGGGSSVDETQVALISQIFGS